MIQIEQDTDTELESDQIILTFYTADMGKYSEDFLAWIQLSESPPIPSEGDLVDLSKLRSELEEGDTESEFDVKEQGNYRAINIDYEYTLAEYPHKEDGEFTGEHASRWFIYAYVEVEEVEA